MLLKKTPTQIFSCEFCELFKTTYFVEDIWTAGSETPVQLFKKPFLQNTFFTSPVAVSAVLGCLAVSDGFRFLGCNFIKKETRAKVFICEFCFKNIIWQNTSRWLLSYVYLRILRSISEHFFIKYLCGKLLISFTSWRISTSTYSKKVFHKCFSSILYSKKK